MSTLLLRPTFRLTSPSTEKATLERIQNAVNELDGVMSGQFKARHAVISISGSDRHFWSPWLNLQVQEEETGCEVFGRFSPHPSVWTAFAFSYIALGVLAFFSTIIGMSQQLAGQPPYAYYSLPVWGLIALVLWLAAQVGQKLANDQMIQMQQLVEESISNTE